VLPGEISPRPPELLQSRVDVREPGVLQKLAPHALLCTGLVAGFTLATNPALDFAFGPYWLALQLVYLRPGYRAKAWRPFLASFLAKLQVRTALKILTHIGAIFLVTSFCDYLLDNSLAPAQLPANTTLEDVLVRRGQNILKLALVWSATISLWRFHRLKHTGYDIVDVAKGSYRELAVTIPAAGAAVEAALALRLQQLQFDKAPRFTRMLLSSRPRARQSSANRNSLQLTWPLCPTAAELAISRAESGTLVHLRCRLRGGLYRFEIFPSPREATGVLNFLRTNLVDATDHEMRMANALRKQDEFKHLAIEAQLRMLQTQIEPHFLFNTLANVQQMYRENIDEGEAMLNHLTAYFRGAVEGFRCDRSTIAKEMELSKRYLAIMKARMGDRLNFKFNAMDDVRNHPLPPAMLISLVENAIKHGIAPNMGGTVAVQAVQVDDVVRLEVSDDGAGFSSVGGTGTGLTNLRDRLDALYGPRAWLEIDAGESGGFKASIVLPFEGLA
jgi:signal transduction histidine kinase